MTTTFTIKQVPDALANRLRRRAATNRRSLQRELLLILENAARDTEHSAVVRTGEPAAPVYFSSAKPVRTRVSSGGPSGRPKKLSLDELWKRARKLGSSGSGESADLIRRDRDARHGH